LTKPNILVVNGQDHERATLSSILKSANNTVSEAVDGLGALASMRKTLPDLILLEFNMVGMDGIEVCQRLKAEEVFRDIPVIFTIGETNRESKIQGYAAGCADYVSKPFIPEELLARVNVHLQVDCLRLQLQEETGRYQALESAAFYGILIHENGIILEVSDTMAEMVDYSPEEIIGRNILEFIATGDHARVIEALKRAEGETRNVIEGVKRDGSRFPIDVQGKSIQYKGRQARVNVVRDLSTLRQMEDENIALRAGLDDRDCLGGLVGKSLPMRRVYNSIIQAAASHENTVIYGETGTGKDLAARTIFELSPRSNGPFVTVNCSAVQESIFESMFFGHKKGAFTGADRSTSGFFRRAEGGVLFLDEIGEFSPTMQAKLLRVLQDGEFTPLGTSTTCSADVRIISASNRSLFDLVKTGQMREDFFHRIHVIPIEMPALRKHKGDIGILISHFMKQLSGLGMYYSRLPDRLFEQFRAYDWPGNVRELFNELRRYHTTGHVSLNREFVKEVDVPEARVSKTYKELLEEFECKILTDALSRHDGNRSGVVRAFAIPRKTLQRKIKKYNL
jgi:PAS domain S-box-containing protein